MTSGFKLAWIRFCSNDYKMWGDPQGVALNLTEVKSPLPLGVWPLTADNHNQWGFFQKGFTPQTTGSKNKTALLWDPAGTHTLPPRPILCQGAQRFLDTVHRPLRGSTGMILLWCSLTLLWKEHSGLLSNSTSSPHPRLHHESHVRPPGEHVPLETRMAHSQSTHCHHPQGKAGG